MLGNIILRRCLVGTKTTIRKKNKAQMESVALQICAVTIVVVALVGIWSIPLEP